jgi:protein phosphatase
MNDSNLADTVTDLPVRPVGDPAPRVVLDFAGRTHPGNLRENNEDNFHIVQFGRYLRALHSSLPSGQYPEEIDRPGYGFAVADGMGGHAAGEVASRAAITLFIDCVLRTPDWIFWREEELVAKVMERTAERFQAVNESIIAQAREQPKLKGMGTTLSMAASLGDNLIVAHLGDSPVYLFRNGHLHRLTLDHTMERERQHFDPNAARFRHVLTRAIGFPGGGTPDVGRYRLTDGDRLILCTDGLTDMADDAAITQELTQAKSSDEASLALIQLALTNGGKDNVTVVVATYQITREAA